MTRPDGFYTDEQVFLREVIRDKEARGVLTSSWATAASTAWPAALAVLFAMFPAGGVAMGVAGLAARGAGLAAGRAGLAGGLPRASPGAVGGAAAGAAMGALLGPIGMLIGGGLGAFASRALSSAEPDESAAVKLAAKRLAAGRRVFAELQELKHDQPAAFTREVDHLYTELVEDSDVDG